MGKRIPTGDLRGFWALLGPLHVEKERLPVPKPRGGLGRLLAEMAKSLLEFPDPGTGVCLSQGVSEGQGLDPLWQQSGDGQWRLSQLSRYRWSSLGVWPSKEAGLGPPPKSAGLRTFRRSRGSA